MNLWLQGEGWGEGTVREFGIYLYALLHLKWITSKDLLYSTGNSAHWYVAAWMRGVFWGKWIPVYVWLSPFAVHLKLSHFYLAISSVQFSRSVVSNSLRPHEPQHARPPWPSPTPRVYPNPCPSNHLILCRPLFLLHPIPPRIRVFSNESAFCIRWPKYWGFCFNIIPFNEHPGLISFRMDWLDLFAVLETLKSLLQHHSSKASILWHSAFFILQHPYMTTGKTIALTRVSCLKISSRC